MYFVVVEGLPETNPDVEQAQAAADAAEKSVVYDGAERRERKQEIVVGPLRGPRKNDEQHPGYGTD
jgi:hypothetical protein